MGRIRDLRCEAQDWSPEIAELHRKLMLYSLENAEAKGIITESSYWNQLEEIASLLGNHELPAISDIIEKLQILLQSCRDQD